MLQLTTVNPSQGAAGGIDDTSSPARFAWWRKQTEVLRDVTAVHTGMINATTGGTMETVPVDRVSAEALACFGIRILRGRAFTPGEDRPNGPAVAVLGEGFWARRFGRHPSILGKTLTLGGEPHTVIGIAAESAALREFGPPAGVYLPFRNDPDSRDIGEYFDAAARLQPGVSLARAQAQLRASTAAYRPLIPSDLDPRAYFAAVEFRESLVADSRTLLWILLAAVGLVLLIACANVASLLLARAAARRREIAIRTALGAGRGRMVRDLLVESVLLVLVGGAAGLALGYAGIRALLTVKHRGTAAGGRERGGRRSRLARGGIRGPRVARHRHPLRPAAGARRLARRSARHPQRGRPVHHRTPAAGARRSRRKRSRPGGGAPRRRGAAHPHFAAMYSVNRGFETRNVLTLHTTMTAPRYLKTAGLAETIREGRARLGALSGVEAAGATCVIPLQGAYDLGFTIQGRSRADGPVSGDEGWSAVSPGFFEAFPIPVKRGRAFTVRDNGASAPLVVINETLARRYWKDKDPLRDRIVIGAWLMKEFQGEPARQIVGVVGDIRDEGLNSRPRGVMYVPQAQLTDRGNAFVMVRQSPLAWVVRTREGSGGMARAITAELAKATGLPVSDVHSMDEVVWLSVPHRRNRRRCEYAGVLARQLRSPLNADGSMNGVLRSPLPRAETTLRHVPPPRGLR